MPHGYADIPIAGGDTATPLNLAKRTALIGRYLERGRSRVIDCGCGEGGYVEELGRCFRVESVGIEYLADKTAQAGRNAALRSRVVRANTSRIPFADATFHLAVLNEVLEHVPDEAGALAEIHRVLLPGGRLVLLSPNRWYPFETHGVYWKGTDRMLPPYVPLVPYIPLPLGRLAFRYWARNYWPGQLASLVRSAGFELVERTWMWQTFENISGSQPLAIRVMRPLLRRIADTLERVPLIQRLGVSQVLVARKG
jgi:SAM-dependent methyltransferase